MNVVMIGSGYVGLVSGACFAEFGASVICVDVDQDKIDRLNAGEIPIYEPGLDDLVARNVSAGRLSFTTAYDPAISEADLVFIDGAQVFDRNDPSKQPVSDFELGQLQGVSK